MIKLIRNLLLTIGTFSMVFGITAVNANAYDFIANGHIAVDFTEVTPSIVAQGSFENNGAIVQTNETIKYGITLVAGVDAGYHDEGIVTELYVNNVLTEKVFSPFEGDAENFIYYELNGDNVYTFDYSEIVSGENYGNTEDTPFYTNAYRVYLNCLEKSEEELQQERDLEKWDSIQETVIDTINVRIDMLVNPIRYDSILTNADPIKLDFDDWSSIPWDIMKQIFSASQIAPVEITFNLDANKITVFIPFNSISPDDDLHWYGPNCLMSMFDYDIEHPGGVRDSFRHKH